MEHASNAIRRCAVYTRKSSEEGLEQDFNSLHAQREASEAFIKRQPGRVSRGSCTLTELFCSISRIGCYSARPHRVERSS
jgi:hypothetical protein